MNISVNWLNIPPSSWLEQRTAYEANKLRRLLPRGGDVQVRFQQEPQRCRAKVLLHALGHDWWAVGEGENFMLCLGEAFGKVTRMLTDFKHSHTDRVHRRWRYSRPAA